MAEIYLRQILTFFEDTKNAVPLNAIARDLNLSLARVESMVEYWVRKGKIRLSEETRDCRSCGVNANCPFVLNLPKSYELVRESGGAIQVGTDPACD
jgi:hypothetical protein